MRLRRCRCRVWKAKTILSLPAPAPAPSLCYLLSMYPSTKVYFVSPSVVRMKDDIKEFLTARGIAWEEVRAADPRRGLQWVLRSPSRP